MYRISSDSRANERWDKRYRGLSLSLSLSLLLVAGCGAGGDFSDGAGSGPDAGGGLPDCFSSSECPTGFECSEFGTCVPPSNPGDAGPEPPAEVELEFGSPSSSLRYVYVAMTDQDSLARIDGQTLAVQSLAVGERPEVVATAPGTDTAVVLDSINGTATVVRPTANQDFKATVKTLPSLNQLEIDPTGRYAVAFFDLNKAILDAGGLEFVEHIGSFQDVTVIDLTPTQERSVDLTVGFRPGSVAFDSTGEHAFVITDDGISVLDLAVVTGGGASIIPPIPITEGFNNPEITEIDVTPSGEFAVAREAGLSEVRIVRLLSDPVGEILTVPLAAEPSDVDLSPDGSVAYAVLRELGQLVTIDIPGDGIIPSGIETVDIVGFSPGSLVLSRDGQRGLLFTNATLQESILVADFSVSPPAVTAHPLEKAVRTAAFSPSGDSALVIHAKAPGDPGDATTFDELIDRSFGYTMFDVATGFPKLEITPVDPGAFEFASVEPRMYLLLDGGDEEGAVAQVHVIDLATGVVTRKDLGTAPANVGILPDADVAFVSQRHPLGRITFLDIASSSQQTITGFDLNSLIID